MLGGAVLGLFSVFSFFVFPFRASAPAPEAARMAAEAVVARLSLSEKIGQLFMFGPVETVPLETIVPLVREGQVGGIILMGAALRATTDLPGAIRKLHAAAVGSTTAALPLFIATDQEGGEVSRFRGPEFIQTPQSALKNPEEAYALAFRRGEELAARGVRMNFAPVMDAAEPPSFLRSRTFRGSREEIAALGDAMVRGYRAAGIVAVPKHFPGHPERSWDSHRVLPTAEMDKKEFTEHIRQFSLLIERSRPEMLMTAHVLFPQVDATYPATLSRVIVTDILRGTLGFEGVVLTDDLQMGAITSRFPLRDAVVRALTAGNDMLLIVGSRMDFNEAFAAVRVAVESGVISEARLDESVLRILRLKQRITTDL